MTEANPNLQHHWSGWPGAYCLKCRCEDPREIALAEGDIFFETKKDPNPESEEEDIVDIAFKSDEVKAKIDAAMICTVVGVLKWNKETGKFDLVQKPWPVPEGVEDKDD